MLRKRKNMQKDFECEVKIKPLHMDLMKYNCMEHNILSILRYNKKIISLYYWDSLNLSYNVGALENCGEMPFRFINRIKTVEKLCLETYGVQIKNCEGKKEDIYSSIQKKEPLLAYVDVFWDRNAKEYYQKEHSSGHSRIICGYKNSLLYYYEWDKKYEIDVEEFVNSMDRLSRISYENSYDKPVANLLKESICNVKNSDYLLDNDKMLKELRNVIGGQEVKKYLSGFAKVGNSPFFNSIRLLARSRKGMAIFLGYIINYTKANERKLEILYSELERSSNKWNIIINLLLKLYIINDKIEEKMSVKEIQDNIEKIRDIEKNIFEIVYNIYSVEQQGMLE